jgi:hypothetical protein
MTFLTKIYNLLVPESKVLILLIIVILLLALGYIFKDLDEEDSDSDDDDDDEIEGMQPADDDPELQDALQLLKKEEPILTEGPRGKLGIRGKKGEVGVQGNRGYKGNQGDQGIQGVKGNKGDKGNRGNKGDKGNRGVRGPVGPVDTRAYSVAMNNKTEMANLAARAAAAEATAAAALAKASIPPRVPKPRYPRRRRRRWGFFSDMRVKTNLLQIGLSATNIPIYSYNYKDFMDEIDGIDITKRYKGVIAQDLLELGYGDAVHANKDGIFSVDYNKIDVKFEIL